MPQVILNRITQLASLEPCAAAIDSDDDILEGTGNVVMPINVVFEINLL